MIPEEEWSPPSFSWMDARTRSPQGLSFWRRGPRTPPRLSFARATPVTPTASPTAAEEDVRIEGLAILGETKKPGETENPAEQRVRETLEKWGVEVVPVDTKNVVLAIESRMETRAEKTFVTGQ
jgi:hypothetical protein